MVPSRLSQPGAARFWVAVVLTGIGAGVGAVVLTELLQFVQRAVWPGNGVDLVAAVEKASWSRHIVVLLAAGVLTGVGQIALGRLTSGNGIDITEAITFRGGRLPALRTLGSAILSIVVVGMGASLGREGAPKQTGAVLANAISDRARLSDDERRLLVACGAGAGMAAAYGVPLGGALFALEVLRGTLALRLVLPAIVAAAAATVVSWTVLPDAPTYVIPPYPSSLSIGIWAILAGPIAGLVSVVFVRLIAWADRNKPKNRGRIVAPAIALGVVGGLSIVWPNLLGNGREISQSVFVGDVAVPLLMVLFLLRPAVTILCVRSGTPGGLFTPTLTVGALLGALLGHAWTALWPGAPLGLFAVLGAAAMLSATTQGPVSTIVLMIELTGRDRSLIVPLLLAVGTATLVARSIEPRSIYDARLNDEQVAERQRMREVSP
jgi:H+/Cl- antiporter ClcA